MPEFTTEITFGDCDPVGIVFYPNTFRWMDAAFHKFLRPFGGHAKLCASLQSVGIGLVDASAQFQRPLRDGDQLTIDMQITNWGDKSIKFAYEGSIEGRRAFSGKEVRCLFMHTKAGIVAGDLAKLREILEVK